MIAAAWDSVPIVRVQIAAPSAAARFDNHPAPTPVAVALRSPKSTVPSKLPTATTLFALSVATEVAASSSVPPSSSAHRVASVGARGVGASGGGASGADCGCVLEHAATTARRNLVITRARYKRATRATSVA